MKSDPVLLDTNLLILLVVGKVAPELIERHKNLKDYTRADFKVLVERLKRAPKIFVTPNILTESSNLLAQIGDPDKTRLFEGFKEIIGMVDLLEEFHVPSPVAVNRPEFVRLGLTDAGALVEHESNYILLTTDAKLCAAAHAAGRAAENFNHFRNLE